MIALLLLSGCVLPLDSQFFSPTVDTEDYVFPDGVVPATALEEVTFESTDGTLLYGVWAHQSPSKPPMIFFHGNSGDLVSNFDRVEAYYAWGKYDVFMADYRGYGRSEGSCSYDGIMEQDGAAIVDYVSTTTGVAPEDIPWIGHSLGGAVAIHTNDSVAAQSVVLESTFGSAQELLDDTTNTSLPSGWFFTDPFDNIAAIANITSPVFIIHGLADTFIPPINGQNLYNAAPDPKELWQPEGVGHSDSITLIPDDYRQRVLAFQAQYQPVP